MQKQTQSVSTRTSLVAYNASILVQGTSVKRFSMARQAKKVVICTLDTHSQCG